MAALPTIDPEAYQLYLKGLFYWNKRWESSIETAIENINVEPLYDPLRSDPRF